MTDRSRPLFVFDGECGFCRFWVRRWRARLPSGSVDFAPYQEVGDRFPGVSEESFRRSAKLATPDGRLHEGAAAALRLLAHRDRGGALWWTYRTLPPFRHVAEVVYRFIAEHRAAAGRVTALLWGRRAEPSRFDLSAWIFLRALAAVYLTAFLSLLVQVDGLVGPAGILPVEEFLAAVADQAGFPEALRLAPTLAWLGGSEAVLEGMAAAGAGLSLLLLFDVAVLPASALAWALYLSLTVAGQEFLAYQWDVLLVEAGFLGVFLSASSPSHGLAAGLSGATSRAPDSSGAGGFRTPAPPFLLVWLLWWLAFRLVLESGVAKLAGGDPVWRDLTALAAHYETQPLPNLVSWYAHRLPLLVHRLSTLGTLVVEAAVPFLFFLPRRVRFAGAWAVILHQTLILLTGNYTFFNVLTIAIVLTMFDDTSWRWIVRKVGPGRRLLERVGRGEEAGPLLRAAVALVAVVAVGVGGVQLVGGVAGGAVPGAVREAVRFVSPLRIVNGYGLFADMTTERPEIVLEGRRGDEPWRAYDFRYKPDDLSERPPQVAPHQPRLDWQMWFAALTAERAPGPAPSYDRWFLRFVEELLGGSSEVTSLLAPASPFRGAPPDRIRAVLYRYEFTSPGERRRTGRWWRRTRIRTYLPPVELEGGRLRRASTAGTRRARVVGRGRSGERADAGRPRRPPAASGPRGPPSNPPHGGEHHAHVRISLHGMRDDLHGEGVDRAARGGPGEAGLPGVRQHEDPAGPVALLPGHELEDLTSGRHASPPGGPSSREPGAAAGRGFRGPLVRPPPASARERTSR